MASLLAATIIAGAGTAMAETTTTTQTTTVKSSTTATPVVTSSTAVNSDVRTAADDAPVMLTGTVKSINDDEFVLSYGSGEITVEMDDWRWDGQPQALPLRPARAEERAGRHAPAHARAPHERSR